MIESEMYGLIILGDFQLDCSMYISEFVDFMKPKASCHTIILQQRDNLVEI